MAPSRSTWARRAAAGLLGTTTLAVLLPLTLAGAATPASPTPRPAVHPAVPPAVRPAARTAARPAVRSTAGRMCVSAAYPALAARMDADIAAALRGRTDTVAVGVRDRLTGVTCELHGSRHFDSASAVKATVMAAVLRRAQEQRRDLTADEARELRAMITYSDNDATTALWTDLGRARFSAFLRLAGMTSTLPGYDTYWGLTQITGADEMRLLDALTDRQDVLTGRWRAYALELMAEVIDEQRWGTPYGTPAGVTAHNKNGWLPRADRGWRVHSLGVFTGSGRDYRMAVLTDDNPDMNYGVDTIQRVALAVHHDLYGGDLAALRQAYGGARSHGK